MKSKLILSILMTTMMCVGQQSSDDYTVKLITNQEVEQMIPFCSETWRTIFSEYPYLYVGTKAEADGYFKWLLETPHAAMAVAYLGKVPVGFVSGLSFVSWGEHSKKSAEAFEKNGLNLQEYFYFSEVIVLPDHRTHNFGFRLYKLVEEHACKMGYKKGCFVTESHDDHPLKPKDYKELDAQWNKAGYKKTPIEVAFEWNTRQKNAPTMNMQHKLAYWVKDFKDKAK